MRVFSSTSWRRQPSNSQCLLVKFGSSGLGVDDTASASVAAVGKSVVEPRPLGIASTVPRQNPHSQCLLL